MVAAELTCSAQLPAMPPRAVVPAIIAARGNQAAWRYLDFFAAHIRNPNTRAASGFFVWCGGLGLALSSIMPVHVAAWIETLTKEGRAAPTVKQHLAIPPPPCAGRSTAWRLARRSCRAVRKPRH